MRMALCTMYIVLTGQQLFPSYVNQQTQLRKDSFLKLKISLKIEEDLLLLLFSFQVLTHEISQFKRRFKENWCRLKSTKQ